MTPVSGIDSPFYGKLVPWAKSEGVDPMAPILVMLSEGGGGISPKAANRGKNKDGYPVAVGINQFSTWGTNGHTAGSTFSSYVKGMTPTQYLGLSASQQLNYALRFFSDQYAAHPGAKQGGARDLYWLNFMPATYVPNAPDSHVITSDAGLVNANKVFADSDGVIRAGGLARAINARANSLAAKAIQQNLIEAGASPLSSFSPSSAIASISNAFDSMGGTAAKGAAILAGSGALGFGLFHLLRHFRKSKR